MHQRTFFPQLFNRLQEKRRWIQVLMGPRQVGKTTLVHQVLEKLKLPYHHTTADGKAHLGSVWLEQQWEAARLLLQDHKTALLVLDEVQKIPQWSEVVKKFWDEDTQQKRSLKVVLLGSSPLLIQSGLTESLAGRFEISYLPHWSYPEIKKSFAWPMDKFFYFGAYPGAAPLSKNENRWRQYLRDSIIETTLSKDILLMTRIHKPSLLRQLFFLACHYSGQILSYQKMVGQLQEAGNTTTLAHYLQLLAGAGLVVGLEKFSPKAIHKRASSPKLQVLNTGLMNASLDLSFKEAKQDRDWWGRIVESAVGAHLWNSSQGTSLNLYYWREGNYEVDFVLQKGSHLVAVEVKSSARRESLAGMEVFSKKFNPLRKLLVGENGISFEKFLSQPAEAWFKLP